MFIIRFMDFFLMFSFVGFSIIAIGGMEGECYMLRMPDFSFILQFLKANAHFITDNYGGDITW